MLQISTRIVKQSSWERVTILQGMALGTKPRALAVSCGNNDPGRSPSYWARVEDDGRVIENSQLKNLSRNTNSHAEFAELI
jgi:hypothetical protein